MNDLEDAIVAATRKAQKTYAEISGYQSLMHGPESFLQTMVALALAKDAYVYPECSPKRIRADHGSLPPGRPPKSNQQKRFDLVVWMKSSDEPRALVEFKLAYPSEWERVVADAVKIKNMLREVGSLRFRAAYMLVYSEAGGKTFDQGEPEAQLKETFLDWRERIESASSLNCRLVFWEASEPKGKWDWHWARGFALYRLKI